MTWHGGLLLDEQYIEYVLVSQISETFLIRKNLPPEIIGYNCMEVVDNMLDGHVELPHQL